MYLKWLKKQNEKSELLMVSHFERTEQVAMLRRPVSNLEEGLARNFGPFVNRGIFTVGKTLTWPLCFQSKSAIESHKSHVGLRQFYEVI